MLIYRIEKIGDRGPYSTDGMAEYERFATAHDYYLHPTPDEDGLPSPYSLRSKWSPYRFGFRTKDQLKNWFHSSTGRVAMARCGWKPYVFELDGRRHKVLHGFKQCMFNREVARMVAELDPETLERI